MSLKDRFSLDVINCFLNTAEFAEAITYTPEGEAGKEINAIVVRGSTHKPWQPQPNDGTHASAWSATNVLRSALVAHRCSRE